MDMDKLTEDAGQQMDDALDNETYIDDYGPPMPKPTALQLRTNFLASIIEPTDEMLNATENIVVGFDDFACGDGTLYASKDTARNIYRAMILNLLAKAIRDEHNMLVDNVIARAVEEDEQEKRLRECEKDDNPYWVNGDVFDVPDKKAVCNKDELEPYTPLNPPALGG